MSGHNKWSKIKHVKAKEDAKKGKIFSKCSHEISLAARTGGDPDMNPRLRSAIDSAKAVSMPKENIDRAIKKGTGELGGNMIQEITYEGYGPSGTAMLVEVASDNTNRSASEIRSIFGKNGGSIATPGSVAFQFERKGQVIVRGVKFDEDVCMEMALESGADDVQPGEEDDEVVFTSSATDLNQVAVALREAGHRVTEQSLISVPQNPVLITDMEVAKAALRLYELLDDYDDTMNVFTNFDIAEDILEKLDS